MVDALSLQERLALLRTAQAAIREAMTLIATAVAGTEAEDWGTVYTLLWLQKVVDHAHPLADIGNLDDLMAHLADGSGADAAAAPDDP